MVDWWSRYEFTTEVDGLWKNCFCLRHESRSKADFPIWLAPFCRAPPMFIHILKSSNVHSFRPQLTAQRPIVPVYLHNGILSTPYRLESPFCASQSPPRLESGFLPRAFSRPAPRTAVRSQIPCDCSPRTASPASWFYWYLILHRSSSVNILLMYISFCSSKLQGSDHPWRN